MSGVAATDREFAEAVTETLARELDSPDLRLVGFGRSGGGHSWETYVASYVGMRAGSDAPGTDGSGGLRVAIKRQPMVGMLGTYDLQREVDLLDLAGTMDIPAPAVVTSKAGSGDERGFYVTSFVEGIVPTSADLFTVVPDEDDRRSLGLQLARFMARMHAFPLSDVPTSLRAQVPDEASTGTLAVRRWRTTYLEGSPVRIPVLDLAYSWMAHRAGDVSGSVSLIHNDLHVGNFISRGGDVAAVLDWETAEISDPAGDLAKFNLPTWRCGTDLSSGLLPLADLLDEYESAGGRRPSEDALRFWTVLSLTKSATIALTSARQFTSGRQRDVRWGNLGFRMLTHLRSLVDLLEKREWGTP